MAREKAKPTEQPDLDEATASPGEALPPIPDTAYPANAAPLPSPPVHTQDRDPADREAWKRERAKQLGYHR